MCVLIVHAMSSSTHYGVCREQGSVVERLVLIRPVITRERLVSGYRYQPSSAPGHIPSGLAWRPSSGP